MANLTRVGLVAVVLLPACGRPPAPQTPIETVVPSDEQVTRTRAADTAPRAEASGDWPYWRGPSRDAVVDTEAGPSSLAKTAPAVRWKTPLSGLGLSSPCVAGDAIYLTTAEEAADEQKLLAFSRSTGEPNWSTVLHRGEFEPKHHENSHASATPACDGERVLVPMLKQGAIWVSAVGLDGEILWQTSAGPFESEHGYGASPVLYGDLVIVSGDNRGSCWVAALDRATGEVVWRTPRQRKGGHGSYASPTIATLAGKPQLMLAGLGRLTAYDPASGAELWYCDGPSEVTANTVATVGDVVIASGGYPEKEVFAIRADGTGDVTPEKLWSERRGVAYVPSPVARGRYVFILDGGGVLTCRKVETGETLWKGRLRGNFSASPILVGDLLLALNRDGVLFVLDSMAGDFTPLYEATYDGRFLATPAAVGGELFLRSDTHLWCLGPDKSVANAD